MAFFGDGMSRRYPKTQGSEADDGSNKIILPSPLLKKTPSANNPFANPVPPPVPARVFSDSEKGVSSSSSISQHDRPRSKNNPFAAFVATEKEKELLSASSVELERPPFSSDMSSISDLSADSSNSLPLSSSNIESTLAARGPPPYSIQVPVPSPVKPADDINNNSEHCATDAEVYKAFAAWDEVGALQRRSLLTQLVNQGLLPRWSRLAAWCRIGGAHLARTNGFSLSELVEKSDKENGVAPGVVHRINKDMPRTKCNDVFETQDSTELQRLLVAYAYLDKEVTS
jgi:hypothetical protein